MNKQNINSIQRISHNLYSHLWKNWVRGGGARSLLSQGLNLALKTLRPPLGHHIRLVALRDDEVELFIPAQKWRGSDSDELLLISARTAFSWLIHKNIHDKNVELRFTEYHIQRLQNFDQQALSVRQNLPTSELELVRLDLDRGQNAQVSGSVLYFTADQILVARIDATCSIEPKSEITWGDSSVRHNDH